MLSVQFLERAEQEVTDAHALYEKQQEGLGEKFLIQLNHYLALIGANPYQYPGRYGNELHVAPMKMYPYVIIYWVDEEQEAVFVTSIFHTSRNIPAEILRRFKLCETMKI